MAVDKKISQLTSLAQVDVSASTDVLPIVDTSAVETKKITVSALVGAGATAGISGAVLTNGTINSTTIGATTPSTGAFTTLTANNTVTFNQANASTSLAPTGTGTVTINPATAGTINNMAIGGSTAAAGTFTNISGTTLTISGDSYLATSSGAVGIGTTSPVAGNKVDVRGNIGRVAPTTGTQRAAWLASNTGGDMYVGLDNSTGLNFDTGTAYSGVLWRSGANPICFVNNNTERMRIDGSGNVGIGKSPTTKLDVSGTITIATGNLTFSNTAQRITGDMSNATVSNRLAFQTSTTNGSTTLNIIPNGTGTASQFVAHMGSDPANTSRAGININSTQSAALVFSDITGTGTYLPMTFYTGGSERMRVDTSGNVLVGGTAARGTTVGTAHIDIFNGTAPAGTLTNGVSLYSSSGDLNFMNSAGNGFKVGYRNLPPVGTQTGSYTLAAGDVGKYVQVSTGGSITIPTSVFAEGDAVSIYNNTTGNITITCSAPTAYIAGTNTVKTSMTLATRGVATVLFYSATACVVSGNVT